MASRKKKSSGRLEFTVTWMLGCLVLLISNSTIFKSYNASVGDPWFNLLLSAVILIMLGKIAFGFRQLQKEVKIANSRIDKVDRLDDEGLSFWMEQVYTRLGWETEPLGNCEAGACIGMRRGNKRVLAVFQVGKRKLTKDYVKLAWTGCEMARQAPGGPTELRLITNSSFTAQARREAAKQGIKLVDRVALIDLLAASEPVSGVVMRSGRTSE